MPSLAAAGDGGVVAAAAAAAAAAVADGCEIFGLAGDAESIEVQSHGALCLDEMEAAAAVAAAVAYDSHWLKSSWRKRTALRCSFCSLRPQRPLQQLERLEIVAVVAAGAGPLCCRPPRQSQR